MCVPKLFLAIVWLKISEIIIIRTALNHGRLVGCIARDLSAAAGRPTQGSNYDARKYISAIRKVFWH